jgi:hypothetical protein
MDDCPCRMVPNQVEGRFCYPPSGTSAEQATQEPGELDGRTVGDGTSIDAALDVLEWRHGVMHDAQVVLPRNLTLGLTDAE